MTYAEEFRYHRHALWRAEPMQLRVPAQGPDPALHPRLDRLETQAALMLTHLVPTEAGPVYLCAALFAN